MPFADTGSILKITLYTRREKKQETKKEKKIEKSEFQNER